MFFTPEEENEWSCAHPEMVAKDLPEGVYAGELVSFKAIERKSDGAKSFVLKYKIISGEHALKSYEHYLGLASKGQMAFARSQLEILGAMKTGDKIALSQVEGLCQSCIGSAVTFEIYKNGQYTNCKLVKTEDSPF